jgi:hypothetical protein
MPLALKSVTNLSPRNSSVPTSAVPSSKSTNL